MGLGDIFNSSTLGGYFTGGLPGAAAGYFQNQAGKKKKEAIGAARTKMEELAREQRAQRMADLDRAMGFFGPVQSEMTRLYGAR